MKYRRFGKKSMKLMGIPDVVIPAKIIKPFSQLLMAGVQSLEGWEYYWKLDWTLNEKRAFDLATKLIQKYA